MTERLLGFEVVTPEDVMAEAFAHDPVASFCLVSGGNDSTVLAHYCRDSYDALVYIDTGTALPGVREFVHEFAGRLHKPLRVLEAGDAYRNLVLSHGFPGPAAHRFPYVLLKERQIRRLVRLTKTRRTDRVLLLTGVRRAESQRRMGTAVPIQRAGAQVWAAPLIDWTNWQMQAYREEHSLPQSDVAALIHRSGECNCGCFAQPGEREMLEALWPTWFEENIASLEREAEAAGLSACRWGERPTRVRATPPGPMCSDCQMSLLDTAHG